MTEQERLALRGCLERASKYVGCGDGSCVFKRPKGMHTNGGCRCKERLQGPFAWQAMAALYRQVDKMTEQPITPEASAEEGDESA